jgi:hypothetical protein
MVRVRRSGIVWKTALVAAIPGSAAAVWIITGSRTPASEALADFPVRVAATPANHHR